jgi:pyrroloquinoline quinone biosynthesis protein B
LHPRDGLRGSPIAAVVLTGAEIDQCAGLLNLREGHAFALYALPDTLDALAGNTMFAALSPAFVERRPVAFGEPFELPGGIEAELFAVPGKVPLYLEDGTRELGETVAGVQLRCGGASMCFVPGCAELTDTIKQRLTAADVVLFDATLFTDDEMIRARVGAKTGRRMGHMPIAGADGSLAELAGLRNRRIYVHINNTNPVLVAGSPERHTVEAAGWEVAADGLEIVL